MSDCDSTAQYLLPLTQELQMQTMVHCGGQSSSVANEDVLFCLSCPQGWICMMVAEYE
jgi:hypothetical protein